MGNLLQLLMNNWLVVAIIIVGITLLIILLWRNFDIEEITPTPPFIKLKRKTSSVDNPNHSATNVSHNAMFGKNKISVNRESSNISDNLMAGENEISIGAKSGHKAKRKGKKQ